MRKLIFLGAIALMTPALVAFANPTDRDEHATLRTQFKAVVLVLCKESSEEPKRCACLSESMAAHAEPELMNALLNGELWREDDLDTFYHLSYQAQEECDIR